MNGTGGVVRSVIAQGGAVAQGRAATLRGSRTHTAFISLLICAAGIASAATAGPADVSAPPLVTWRGWEPDKAATAWYWIRHVAPRSEIKVVPAGTVEGAGVFIDTPTAEFRRTQNSSTLESLLRRYPTSDPAILKLARLSHDIEINSWRPRAHPESTSLEKGFRDFLSRWNDEDPPAGCVLEYFDRVYVWLKQGGPAPDGSVPCTAAAETIHKEPAK